MKSEELAPREGRCQSGHRNKRFGCGAAMVEFSNREQIERWLEQVQPARRQREVGAALAVRAALRVVPLLKAEFELHTDVRDVVLSEIVLRVFRATLISWFSVKYPREKNKFRAAAAANIGPSDPETALTPGSDFVLESVFAAFRVAEVPISDCITTVGYAVDQAIHAAAEAAAREGEGPPGAGSVSSDEDAEAIDSGLRAVEVAGNPLWPTGTPSWAAVAWQDFKEIMLSSPDDWEVWTDWYEARLVGDAAHPPNEDLEIARATIADEIWQQGPTAVNDEIRRLIAEHEGDASGDHDANPELVGNDDSDEDQSDFESILATRGTLRVLPFLGTDDRIGDRVKSRFVLSVFHALAAAWTRTEFPEFVSSNLSLAAARDISPFAPTSPSAALFIGQAAAHVGNSAGHQARGAAASYARAADLQIRQALHSLRNQILLESVAAQATAHDRDISSSGFTAKQIGAVALWPGGSTPGAFLEQWQNLKQALLHANEGWGVWIEWYEARLDGRTGAQEVELAYVNYTKNVSPTTSAWEANSEIKRLIDLYEPKAASPPPIESIPEQERTGTRFGMGEDGRIDVLQTPPTTDDLQRFHYDEMRHKAQALSELGQMLGDIAPAITRILEALPERMEQASVDRLWSRANTLRRRHNAHVRSSDNKLEPDPGRLHGLVAETLGDFIDSFNVYVIGDPRGLELDRIRLGPQDREAARKIIDLAEPIARAAAAPDSPATPVAQETISEQVSAAIDAPDDLNGDQATELARKTTGNFVGELLRRAYAPIKKSGEGVKKEASFAQKEFRAGIYRAAGAATFGGFSITAYAFWPEIATFVARNADTLKSFVMAAYNNPKLVEIIDLISRATGH